MWIPDFFSVSQGDLLHKSNGPFWFYPMVLTYFHIAVSALKNSHDTTALWAHLSSILSFEGMHLVLSLSY